MTKGSKQKEIPVSFQTRRLGYIFGSSGFFSLLPPCLCPIFKVVKQVRESGISEFLYNLFFLFCRLNTLTGNGNI